MTASLFWKRPDIVFPHPFDTIFFDVDGVLIHTTPSFIQANIAATEYITDTLHGLDWGSQEGKQLVTLADVEVFKQAGGFNSDWDTTYVLSGLATARLREWSGTSLAERTTAEWAALARAAAVEGRGGRAWADSVLPASACTDYDTVVDVYNECYWGAKNVRTRLGREPRYMPQAVGYVHNEKMLYAPDFFARLRQAGIVHLGMITGRTGPEVDSAVERMEAYSGERWWDVLISADMYAKPDPQALRAAMAAVNTQGGLYIGDTADDYDLIRLYKETKSTTEPDMLSAMAIQAHEFDLYRQRGADFLLHSVEQLLDILPVRS
jgi:HAD superfamily phosphatase